MCGMRVCMVRVCNGEATIEGRMIVTIVRTNTTPLSVVKNIHTFSIYPASISILLDTKDEFSISTPIRI